MAKHVYLVGQLWQHGLDDPLCQESSFTPFLDHYKTAQGAGEQQTLEYISYANVRIGKAETGGKKIRQKCKCQTLANAAQNSVCLAPCT